MKVGGQSGWQGVFRYVWLGRKWQEKCFC